MDIILLHSAMVGTSRDLLASLGVAIPEGDDVTVTVGSDTVRIISKHVLAVGVCPAFPGYPTAAVTVDGKQYVLAFPATWAAVTAWAANPVPVVEKSTVMSRYVFSQRFHADEMIGILAAQASDPAVALFMKLLDYAQEVDLTDVNLQSAFVHMVTAGLLTQERATAILTP